MEWVRSTAAGSATAPTASTDIMQPPPLAARSIARTGAASLIAAIVLVACGGDDDGSDAAAPTTVTATATSAPATTSIPTTTEASVPSTSTTTTTSVAPTSTTGRPAEGAQPDGTGPGTISPENVVIAAYEASWVETAAAYDPIDPDHPSISDHLTGDVEAALRGALAERSENRRSLRGTFGFAPRVESIDGDVAIVVDDCFTDDGEEYDVDTGETVDTFETRAQIQVTMVREDGVWKRAAQERLGEGCL